MGAFDDFDPSRLPIPGVEDRHVPYWLGGLALVGAGTLLWAVHRLTAPEPTDIFPDELSGDGHGVDSPQTARTLAMNLDAPMVEGNRIELLENGDEIFPPMLEAIRDAKHSINFLTFVYWTGDIAREFAEALAAAAERGVEVRVLLDAFGAAKMPRELMERMEAGGCRVRLFHSVRWYTLRRFNNRTHRKVLVVDGRVGFTGGVGIADEWTGDATDPDHWRDDHFRVTGPVVLYLQGAFAENWREESGEALSGAKMFPEIEPAGDATVVPILGQPRGSVSRIGFTFWLSLQSAKERVRLVTPYFSPDPSLYETLVETAERGVEVTILLPNHRIDKEPVRWVAKAHYDGLLEAGCRIFEFEPTMMHTKVLTVDDDWSVVGSANFDNRSFDLNYELALAVVDPDFTASLNRSIDRDLERSHEVRLGDVDDWSALQRARNQGAVVLRQQL